MAIEEPHPLPPTGREPADHPRHYSAGELSGFDFERYGLIKKTLILIAFLPLLVVANLARILSR